MVTCVQDLGQNSVIVPTVDSCRTPSAHVKSPQEMLYMVLHKKSKLHLVLFFDLKKYFYQP